MMRILLICLMLLSALVTESWAQDRTVSGKVTDDSGESVPGANVIVKGTTTGTTADIDGNYKLSVPEGGGTLIYTFVGMSAQEIEIGSRSVIDVTMTSDSKKLSEVVVTAMGVSREKASLGYAQQSLSNEDLNRTKSDNILKSLSGKAAGVSVRQTQTMGGSMVVNIRGNSSVIDNNPLFVIDGVPIQNATRNSASQQTGGRGYDYGNPASDINPDDVESMSILKGAAATALYGSRGQNGVVLITTKKGTSKKGIGVEISTGVTVGKIDKSTFAEYQDEYGAGYGPYYNEGETANQALFVEDINGDGIDDFVVPTTEDGSYGEKLDGSLTAYQWDSFVPGEENFGQAYAYTAGENTPVEFFESQVITNTNVALSGGNETSSFRLSYTNYTQDGILPNSNMAKNTVNFNGSTKLGDRLSTDVMFQYNKHDLTGAGSTGYSDNLMSQLRQWWQVNVDVKQLEDVYNRTGLNYTWNGSDYNDPLTPIYWDNPYWTRYENYNTQVRDRVLSKIGIQYKITDWLSFNGRASIDNYTELREERRAVGSVASSFGVTLADEQSGYSRNSIESTELNYNGILNFNKNITDDISLVSLVGFNLQKESYESIFASTSGGLSEPGLYSLSNSVNANPLPSEALYEKEVYGYFANLNIGFKDMLYLDGNFRTDISSSLSAEHRQYNYGGASVGFVFSELIDASFMSFGKFRASYATVGNDTRALRVNDTFNRSDNFQGAILNSIPSTKNNSDLKSELTTEFELGLEGAFFNNRVSFDLAYYNRETSDQLMAIETSRASGYSNKFINVGTIRNRGIELMLSGDVVRTSGVVYNLAMNFTRNRNKVLDLNDDNGNVTNNYTVQSYQGGISSNATVGQPLGVLRGTGFAYHENGERLIDGEGFYVAEGDQIIGDPNADFNIGFNNSISYKGVTLGFLVDWSQGGDVYSLDMHFGQGTGVLAHTAGNNELGNPKRDPVTSDGDSGGILNSGVQADGTVNTIRADASDFNGAYYWGDADVNPAELTVYDASYVKLREVRITYSLPSKMLGSWSQGVDLSLVGTNLWIIHKNVPYADPESGLGGQFSQGYLSGSYPTVRTLGFAVKLKI